MCKLIQLSNFFMFPFHKWKWKRLCSLESEPLASWSHPDRTGSSEQAEAAKNCSYTLMYLLVRTSRDMWPADINQFRWGLRYNSLYAFAGSPLYNYFCHWAITFWMVGAYWSLGCNCYFSSIIAGRPSPFHLFLVFPNTVASSWDKSSIYYNSSNLAFLSF